MDNPKKSKEMSCLNENIWSQKIKGVIMAKNIWSKNSKEMSWLRMYYQKLKEMS